MRFVVFIPLMAAAGMLAGCSSLLPHGSTATPTPFESFDEARAAAGRIQPLGTAAAQLPALGFDPERGRNVTVIPYPEIVARLAPYPGVPFTELDEGVRRCILARTACTGYLFRFERVERRREGPFLPDFLNVRRVTHVTGWWFETLVVVSGGTVLFRNFAGQPHVDRQERQINPLGPLQPAGENAGSLLRD